MNRLMAAFEALIFHAGCSFKAELKRYYLHFLWWFMEPILTLAVLYLVFGVFLASSDQNLVFNLLTGLILWQWFSSTVPHATNSIYGSMRMFQQFRVHPIHFPLCVFLQDLIKYLPVFFIFLIFIAIFGPNSPSSLWFNIIPIFLVEGLCVLGVAVFVAALTPFLPDLSVVVPIIIQILFFASGIIFDPNQVVQAQHRLILYLNPNAVCIQAMKDILIKNQVPEWNIVIMAAGISFAFLMAGMILVTACRNTYPRIIEQ